MAPPVQRISNPHLRVSTQSGHWLPIDDFGTGTGYLQQLR
jgi:sensor c-di-GMP phosphodiesterase-like protein